jgi:hypothetical protein
MLAARMDTLAMGSSLGHVSQRHSGEYAAMVLEGARVVSADKMSWRKKFSISLK